MDPINIAAPDFSYDESDPENYRCGMHRIGKQLGLTSLGASVYEIAPGQSLCPYHYEYGEQEALLVLQGRPTLRRPQGTQVLEPWDTVGFPSGPEGAHKITNETDENVRVFMFSTVTYPAATVYPDSGKVGVWVGNPDDDLLARKSDKRDYYDGEV
ncbi:MAG TPA: cupin domain-containing protein [Gaiellales bacterium]|jgi:uncharacterized cupin superfamily protein